MMYQFQQPRPSLKSVALKALRDEESYGSTLLIASAHLLGLEELSQLSVDAVVLELKEETGVDLTGTLNEKKLIAAMTILFDPAMFYEDVQGFIDICNVLSGSDIDADVFDPADPYEMSWAVAEANFLDPKDEGEPERFTEELRTFIGITLSHFGFVRPPFNLRSAIVPQGVNPALDFADIPDLATASVQVQDELVRQVSDMVNAQLEELNQQVAGFLPFAQETAASE